MDVPWQLKSSASIISGHLSCLTPAAAETAAGVAVFRNDGVVAMILSTM
jgi:hypothetical protein